MHLSSRVTLSIIVVPAVLVSFFGALSIDEERQALQDILRRQGSLTAHSIASYSVEALISEDYPALDQVLYTVGSGSDDIVQIEVTHDKHVVARYDGTATEEDTQTERITQAVFSNKQKIGEVILTLSGHENEAFIENRVKHLVLHLSVAFVLFSLLLHHLLSKMVVSRIEKLKAITEQVIATELPDNQANRDGYTNAKDEIDLLHERFVSMIEGLRLKDTAREAMLTELAAARILLEDVANAMHSALIVVTLEGNISFCNRAAQAEESAIGQPLSTVLSFPEEDLATILSEVHNQRTVERMTIKHRQHEQLHYFEVAIYPLSQSAEGGSLIRIDDVTERVHIQEAIVQTEKLASVGGLAAGVAHEINNPLGVMVQAAQNIERRLSESLEANHRAAQECGTTVGTIRAYLEKRSILNFLDDIKSDGERASKIVRNLLEFSRKSESTPSLAMIDEVFEQTVELARKDYDLKKNIDFRQIRISTEIDSDLPPVPMLRSQIEQVLLNLLKNSAQALSEKLAADAAFEPKISLRARLDEGCVRIEVHDNGPGFSIDARRRAFEPFFTTKAPGMGTGLGLWISYAIVVDKHGGKFTLDSTPGQGATFTLMLPLNRGEKNA